VISPAQRRAIARYYYRKWPTDALFLKRSRLLSRLVGIEEVLTERGHPVLPVQTLTRIANLVAEQHELH